MRTSQRNLQPKNQKLQPGPYIHGGRAVRGRGADRIEPEEREIMERSCTAVSLAGAFVAIEPVRWLLRALPLTALATYAGTTYCAMNHLGQATRVDGNKDAACQNPQCLSWPCGYTIE